MGPHIQGTEMKQREINQRQITGCPKFESDSVYTSYNPTAKFYDINNLTLTSPSIIEI